MHKQLLECEARPSKMASSGSQNALQIHPETNAALQRHPDPQKDHFFLAGTPMGEATNTPKTSPEGIQNIFKTLHAGIYLQHQLFIKFEPSEKGVWIANQSTFRTTLTCMRLSQLLFDFLRMSLAFCMVLSIANTVFWHHKCFISITFSCTSPTSVLTPNRPPRRCQNAS